jgi:ferritin-like metal-binding protein YciE
MSQKKLKQVIAVITFEDNGDNILGLSDAATWLDGKLRSSGTAVETLEVTTFTTAAHAAQAETERSGDFALDAERLLGH